MAAHFRAAGIVVLAVAGVAIAAACSLNAQPLPPLSGGDNSSDGTGGERSPDGSFSDKDVGTPVPTSDAGAGVDAAQPHDAAIDALPGVDAGDAAPDAPGDAPEGDG